MAYADQPKMSTSRMVAIVIVILIHAVLGYAFVTGLAYNVVKKAAEDLNVFDVQDEPPPPEEPPPPPPPQQEIQPPPVVTPPPIVQTNVPPPPQIVTVNRPPPVFVPAPVAAPPPPPPPAPVVSKAAGAKGDPSRWITNDDYPASAIRAEAQGTTGISWDINEQGRVENCQVTSSSGNSDLDRAACAALVRRGRYSPAVDQNGSPIRSKSSRRVRWVLPEN